MGLFLTATDLGGNARDRRRGDRAGPGGIELDARRVEETRLEVELGDVDEIRSERDGLERAIARVAREWTHLRETVHR